MKFAALLCIPALAMAKLGHSSNQRRAQEPIRAIPTETNGGGPTWMPGHFDWGMYARDYNGGKVRVSNGLMGRAVALVDQPVKFTDGTTLKDDDGETVLYHQRADGGAVIPKEDGSGYYYVSNSENGGYPDEGFDPNAPRSDYAGNLTGGVYSLEFDASHNFVGYKQVLKYTGDNCAGGATAWGTWVSCEEERTWGRCWQVDPEGVIEAEPTAVTNPAYYGIEGYGNWEAFAWDEVGGHGYTTDDDHPGDGAETKYGALKWRGALVRYTPDMASLECWQQTTKAERWCTLNSGTFDYLKLSPTPGGSNEGTFEWVSIEESNPELYRQAEGIHIDDNRIMTFVAKRDQQIFVLNLADGTFTQRAAFSSQQPDNIRGLGSNMYYCTDGPNPNGVWADDGTGAYKILEEITYDTETAGIDFTPDGKVMLVSFQAQGTWQFWREDGYSFLDPHAGALYTREG